MKKKVQGKKKGANRDRIGYREKITDRERRKKVREIIRIVEKD